MMAGSVSPVVVGLLVAVVVLAALPADAWSGNNVCSRNICCYRRVRVCKYRWRGRCCSYKWINQGYTCPQQYCCRGWTHNGNERCDIPVCSPKCRNGGTCVSPGKCNCPQQYDGIRCNNARCSHRSPCYPGVCDSGDGCDCLSGFKTEPPISRSTYKQEYCLKIEDGDSSRLDMYQMQVRLSYWPRGASTTDEPLHWIMADSTNETDTDSFWTNRKDFNRLETTCSSQFFSPDISQGKPLYIGNSSLGVVQGNVQVYLSKLGAAGSTDRFGSLNKTISCEKSVSGDQPEEGIFNCSVTDLNFDRLLEHRDRLTVRFTSKTGGFRDLRDPNTKTFYRKQHFIGYQRDKAVEFKFDFQQPVHCVFEKTCKDTNPKDPLHVPDYTKSSELTIKWQNWTDRDSAMNRYAWEVFRMTKVDQELEIRFDVALKPLVNQEVNHSTYTPQTFNLPEPGMFSVILEAGDLANNTRYVRRLVLYDPNPVISTDPVHALFIIDASADVAAAAAADSSGSGSSHGYSSQSSGPGNPVVVTWRRHFRNAFHEDNALLGRVRIYPKELRDLDTFRKDIPRNTSFDDWEGARTVAAVPNHRGIVKFHYAHATDKDGGLNQPQQPDTSTSPWTDVGLNTTVNIPDSASESDTITVWVKATDFTGTEKVERTQVTFDQTAPLVDDIPELIMNVKVEGIDFGSTFAVSATDNTSGIAYVEWIFTRTSNGEVIYRRKEPGIRLSSCSSSELCYCTPAGVCFARNQSLSFSNCRMVVEKRSLTSEVINVTAAVTNMAGLVTRVSMRKDDLTALNGTRAYYPPQNIRVSDLTTESVTLTWSFPPSCFRRTALWVLGAGDRRAVHVNASSFALTGLEAGTSYVIYMVTDFEGKEQSDQAPVRFTTVEAVSLGAAGIVGLAIGFLILVLLIVLIVIFCLWRRGKIFQKEGTPVNRQLQRVSRAVNTVRNSVRKTAGSYGMGHNAGEDEVYAYGAMTFGGARQGWQLDDASLTLLDQVAEGRFATVFKAVWRRDGGSQDTVAAKMLKPGFSEDDSMKMLAKINFAATRLENHDNVIRFLGAVTDHESWGPVLVMEYCESGQLDKWLVSKRDGVDQQVLNTLGAFSLGIANAMEYLASKQVTHKRLAARNVLLTFMLEVRVAGFGPQHKEGDEDKATKVPAKWVAPEVLTDRPSTEKSDVWSYGVVLWEIFSMGQVPYPDIPVAEMGSRLKSGYRMEKPEYADNRHYDLMTDCWHQKASRRPTFSAIRSRLIRHDSSAKRHSQDLYYSRRQLQGDDQTKGDDQIKGDY